MTKKIAYKLLIRKNTRVSLAFNWYLTAIYLLMKALFILVLIV